jgi:hypothetical protein
MSERQLTAVTAAAPVGGAEAPALTGSDDDGPFGGLESAPPEQHATETTAAHRTISPNASFLSIIKDLTKRSGL